VRAQCRSVRGLGELREAELTSARADSLIEWLCRGSLQLPARLTTHGASEVALPSDKACRFGPAPFVTVRHGAHGTES
jgi:hypothetical protein